MKNWKHQSQLIRTYRALKGISQMTLDKELGGTVKTRGQTVSNWERGTAGVPSKHVSAICEALDMPVKDLIGAMVMDYQEELIRDVWAQQRPELKHLAPQIEVPAIPPVEVPPLPQLEPGEFIDG